MSDDVAEFGGRLREAGVPLTLPGALVVLKNGVSGRWFEALDRRGRPTGGGIMWNAGPLLYRFNDSDAAHLNLADGATRGAVLAWLRETYGEFNLCPRHVGGAANLVIWWCYSPNVESIDDLPSAPTEAEALVVAAEWLHRGRWEARFPRSGRASTAPPKRKPADEVPDVS
jgi:hypothetical protein